MKKLLANKNTVTVIGLVVVIAVLYFAYNWRVNQATNPITVPYAIKTIKPGTQITEDMVGSMKVSPSMVTDGVITEAGSVVDKYANVDTVIPEGSLFYERTVVEKENLPYGGILDYQKGYVVYNMAVDTRSTYGNSIYPGNYIDIYIKILKDPNTSEAAMYVGRLIENIKVTAVKDEKGNSVFANVDEDAQPAMIMFAVPRSYFNLLKKAEALESSYQSQLIPVPTNAAREETAPEVNITSKKLETFIETVTKSKNILDDTGEQQSLKEIKREVK
jgi:hypothetical protein